MYPQRSPTLTWPKRQHPVLGLDDATTTATYRNHDLGPHHHMDRRLPLVRTAGKSNWIYPINYQTDCNTDRPSTSLKVPLRADPLPASPHRAPGRRCAFGPPTTSQRQVIDNPTSPTTQSQTISLSSAVCHFGSPFGYIGPHRNESYGLQPSSTIEGRSVNVLTKRERDDDGEYGGGGGVLFVHRSVSTPLFMSPPSPSRHER